MHGSFWPEGLAGTGPPGRPRSLLDQAAATTLRVLVLVLGGYIAFQAVMRLELLVIPFAAALLFTALVHPLVGVLRRTGLPSAAATAITALLLVAVLGAILTWVVNRTISEFPRLVDAFSSGLRQLPVQTSTLSNWKDQLVAAVQSHQSSVTGGVLSGLQIAGELGTGIVLTIFVTFYLLYDGEGVWNWFVRLFPRGRRQSVNEAGERVWHRLSGWVRGTAIIATFHGVVVGIALWIMGVPLVVSLAILVFIGSFVPIVGAFVFGGAAVIVAFATQGPTVALVLVGVLVLDNQAEAHILQPFLVGRYVQLHPLAIVSVLTAGGVLWGLPGAIFAVPLTAALNAIAAQVSHDRAEAAAAADSPAHRGPAPEEPSPPVDAPD